MRIDLNASDTELLIEALDFSLASTGMLSSYTRKDRERAKALKDNLEGNMKIPLLLEEQRKEIERLSRLNNASGKMAVFNSNRAMRLTDVELEVLIAALASVTVMDGQSKSPDQIRLERKLNRWRDHPDLEFAE